MRFISYSLCTEINLRRDRKSRKLSESARRRKNARKRNDSGWNASDRQNDNVWKSSGMQKDNVWNSSERQKDAVWNLSGNVWNKSEMHKEPDRRKSDVANVKRMTRSFSRKCRGMSIVTGGRHLRM